MSPSRLVIIGADAAGMSAAAQARRSRGPDDLDIVVLERSSHTSYSACGIPFWIGGEIASADDLVARTVQEHREKHHLDMRMRVEATAIDAAASTVAYRYVDSGRTGSLEYDQLMIATGAERITPSIPGVDATGVLGVRNLDDGGEMLAALERDPQHVVIVGGGYVGIEMAEALRGRGLRVTVATSGDQPMSNLDPDMGVLVARAMREAGVDVHVDARLTHVLTDAAGAARGITLQSRTGTTLELPADLVVLGLGVRPASGLAEAAGIAIGETGGIQTDASMRSRSHPNIWAAGDCVETIHRVSLAPTAIALGTHANKQGRVAGTNLGGGHATFPGVIGTAATRFRGLEIARTGLSEAQARLAGFATYSTRIESTTQAGYLPGAEAITVKLITDVASRRLLGAQIVGGTGSAKRIDVLATAIWNSMSVEAISEMDLSYAPPFGPVWDPVLIAARKAVDAVAARNT
jgi:NADPH-dependent 2,4-dienoyl-CoA reductase/sulfur reductase-like enzyme